MDAAHPTPVALALNSGDFVRAESCGLLQVRRIAKDEILAAFLVGSNRSRLGPFANRLHILGAGHAERLRALNFRQQNLRV